MMRYIKLIILFVITTMATSCSDWLDVQPTSLVDGQEQIASADGFQQILDGAYISMGDPKLYGKELSYGLIESVALNHFNVEADPLQEWKYLADEERERIDNIFVGSYNIIANLNFLLDNLDAKKELFAEDHFNYVKSEARAMRAFLHFDLLRAFAKNYTNAPQELSIPYVSTYEKRVFEHLSAEAVVNLIIQDLDFAEETLLDIDPLVGKTSFDFMSDDGLNERKYRFNYFSILAIKARVYQYAGEYELASTYAQKVIDEFPFQMVPPFLLSSDKILFAENIFTLDVKNLYRQYLNEFSETKYTAGDSWDEWGKKIYDVVTGGAGANDARFQNLFEYDKYAKKNLCSKYDNEQNPRIPLLKISEMYLILAENLRSTDADKAVDMINVIRFARGVNPVAYGVAEEELMSEIVKEFRKDTYLEGQIFFMYKRLGLTQIPAMNNWPGVAYLNSDNYIFPMPENEIEFGFGYRN